MQAEVDLPLDDHSSILYVVRAHNDNDVVLKLPVEHIQHYSSFYHVGLLRLLGWVLTGSLGEVSRRGDNTPLRLNHEVRGGEYYRYIYEGPAAQLNLNYFVALHDVIATDDRVIDLGVGGPSASSTGSDVSSASLLHYRAVVDRDKVCIFTKSHFAACKPAHIIPRKLKGCDGLDSVLRRIGIEALDAVNNRLLLQLFVQDSWYQGDILLLATDARFIPAVPPAPGLDWEQISHKKLLRDDFTTIIPTTGDETWSIHYQELPDWELRTEISRGPSSFRDRIDTSLRDRVELLRDPYSFGMVHNRAAELPRTLSAADAPSRDALHMLYGVALIRRYLFRGGGTLSSPIWDTASSVSDDSKRRSVGKSNRGWSRNRLRLSDSTPPPPPPPGGSPRLDAYGLWSIGAETEDEREKRFSQWVRLCGS